MPNRGRKDSEGKFASRLERGPAPRPPRGLRIDPLDLSELSGGPRQPALGQLRTGFPDRGPTAQPSTCGRWPRPRAFLPRRTSAPVAELDNHLGINGGVEGSH